MESIKNRRRNFYIKKRFQRNFIIKFCVLVMAASALSGAIVYALSGATVTTTFENSRLVLKSTADFILPSILMSGAVVTVIIGLAAIIITLFTSHRIAGPLYRMEKDVNEVTSGNLRISFNLRQGDELKALAQSLDSMARSLRNKVSGIKASIDDICSSVSSRRDVPSDIMKKVDSLRELTDKFET